jgi:hypothetical protein
MLDEDQTADALLSGSLRRSRSYHAEYGGMTYRRLVELASAKPPDLKARQMKKLIEQADRLRRKGQRPRG